MITKSMSILAMVSLFGCGQVKDTFRGEEKIEIERLEGTQGEQGKAGLVGVQGHTGLKGDKGVRGYAGTTGARGEKGATGATGLSGIAGAKGETGDRGLDGSQGTTGTRGPQGIQGSSGQKGEEGFSPIVTDDGNGIKITDSQGNQVWIPKGYRPPEITVCVWMGLFKGWKEDRGNATEMMVKYWERRHRKMGPCCTEMVDPEQRDYDDDYEDMDWVQREEKRNNTRRGGCRNDQAK